MVSWEIGAGVVVVWLGAGLAGTAVRAAVCASMAEIKSSRSRGISAVRCMFDYETTRPALLRVRKPSRAYPSRHCIHDAACKAPLRMSRSAATPRSNEEAVAGLSRRSHRSWRTCHEETLL